jgi:hypothetical protein
MVIRYEIEFKGRALSVRQEISPDGSASGNNKPKEDEKDRFDSEGVENTQQIHGLDLATKHGVQDKPQGSTPTQRSSAQIPGAGANSESTDTGGSGSTESPGPGGGPLAGLVIIFGPVIVPPPGGPGGGGGGNPEKPGPG